MPLPNRRRFLTTAGSGTLLAAPALRLLAADAPADGRIRLGLIADVHQDVMPDGVERITAFVEAMQRQQAHGIVNLGDFCVPHARNDRFLAAFDRFTGLKLHVLGNHDTDGGFKREQALEFWKSPARSFSRDEHGLHLVVLDGNDPDGRKGYPCSVNDEQLAWLEKDLAATKAPTVIFIHQPIDAFDKHVRTAGKVRAVLARANEEAGFTKVIAVFSGHAHLDYVKESDGIPHVQVNSASYVWVDKKHANYDAAIQQSHPWVAATCPYAEPLWALVTFDVEAGRIEIAGRETTWVGPDPWQVGLAEDAYQRSRDLCRPAITARVLGG
jgi:3',5'-cyclic AMP phosphodiesterase CpdA